MTKRLFIALKIPEEYLKYFEEIKQKLDIKVVRWTKRENLHITSLFLGNVEEDLVQEVSGKIGEIVENSPVFNLEFKEITLAPPGKKPTMVWAAFHNSIEFENLAANFFESLKNLILNLERPKPIPHVTLARDIREAGLLRVELRELCTKDTKNAESDLTPVVVDKIYLIESKLRKEGPIYEDLEETRLKSRE